MIPALNNEPTVHLVKHSVSPDGIHLPTFHLRYWRAIHAELMTHRVFSRNARSSRAVPGRVLLTEPIFIPQFGMNKPGMQSEILASPELQAKWEAEWIALAQTTRDQVSLWHEEGMHKQWANRPLEWFGWIDVLVTSTAWKNFFELRISDYAQPEFDKLANLMYNALAKSTPQELKPGEWHLPYVDKPEEERVGLDLAQRLSTARCARLSYKPFDGSDSIEAELSRYEKLVVSRPVHASPAEHQATPDKWGACTPAGKFVRWANPQLHGNFTGWIQYRKTLPNEAIMEHYHG